MQPAVFLGHGNPMNVITDNPWRPAWVALGEELPRPQAILCVSAHWETRGIGVTGAAHPDTYHDFHGFPQALYDVRYPVPGDARLVRRLAELLAPDTVHAVEDRGLDHGVWAVLRPMYPDADIPVVQLSMDASRSFAEHYELAGKLRPLRDEGVLIVGSGNIVHNLGLRERYAEPADWGVRFDAEIRQAIRDGAHDRVIDAMSHGDDARLSVPTPEHYLPLLYVLGATTARDRVRFFNERVYSTLSMTCAVFEPAP